MKTDPNEGCNDKEERAGWAFLHDAVSHPFMALTGYSRWSIRFHNYTSNKAWPRPPKDKK